MALLKLESADESFQRKASYPLLKRPGSEIDLDIYESPRKRKSSSSSSLFSNEYSSGVEDIGNNVGDVPLENDFRGGINNFEEDLCFSEYDMSLEISKVCDEDNGFNLLASLPAPPVNQH